MTEQAKKIKREELYERIWKMPATKLSKELGISDVALAKICRELNVPKPPLGHWRRVERGLRVQRAPLRVAEKDEPTEATIDPEPHRFRVDLPQGTSGESERGSVSRIVVPDTLHGAHPLTAKMKKLLEATKTEKSGLVQVPGQERVLAITVSKAQVHRALRITDALIKALEERGGKFLKAKDSAHMALTLGDDSVSFGLTEELDKSERQPANEKERESHWWKWDKWEYRPSGRPERTVVHAPDDAA